MATEDRDPIRVVLCDDVAELRNVMRAVLEQDGEIEVVAEASNGRDGARATARLQPDVVILDLSMPDMDGLEAIPLIARSAPGTGIVVLSGFGGRMKRLALARGADRYLEKGERLEVVRVALTEVAHMRRAK